MSLLNQAARKLNLLPVLAWDHRPGRGCLGAFLFRQGYHVPHGLTGQLVCAVL